MRNCRKCGGHTDVYSVRRRTDGTVVRYLRCVKCDETDKQIVPNEFSRQYRDAGYSTQGGTLSPST